MKYKRVTKCNKYRSKTLFKIIHVPMYGIWYNAYKNKARRARMNGKYYTKARAECNARYNDKFEEIKVRVPDGKKSKYKEAAKAEEKSLNQFIIDCVEKESGACKMYTAEMVKLLGEVYYELLGVMNKKHHDPYWQISDRYPMKCLVMILPRAMSLGIPKELNEKIGKIMDMISSTEEMNELMTKQMPMELVMAYEMGKNARYTKQKDNDNKTDKESTK